MDYICPHCDTELELTDVETYQDCSGSYALTEFNTWCCPNCGRTYQNQDKYVFVRETELKEIK